MNSPQAASYTIEVGMAKVPPFFVHAGVKLNSIALDELWSAIGRLLDACLPAECSNYLSHCGYGTT
jgi:hypothetical protein